MINFQLRPWLESDIQSLAEYANNWNVARNLTDLFPYPYSEEDALAYIQHTKAISPQQIFAIVVEGKAVGSIGVFPKPDIFRKNAEMGYWLAEPFWGHGIMTRAIKEMVHYGFETFDVNRIYACPFGSNMGSRRALEKAGFILEATLKNTIFKKDRVEDECIYANRKNSNG